MPFEVYTGMPGAGKTSLLMERLLEAHERNLKHRKSGKPQLTVNGVEFLERPIFAAGIDGLQDGLAEPLEDPTRWQDLPDGALIFIDEVWKWFGHLDDASRKPPPPHVQGIAEHRHKGMDFIVTTQGPNQVYPFMRSLMGPHHHVVRRFGSTFIDVYTWGELVQDPSSQGMRERGTKATRTIPDKGHKLYKSASVHTIKTKIPFKLIAAAIGCLVALPLLWYGVQMMRPEAIAKIGKQEAAPEKARLAGPSGDPHQDGPGNDRHAPKLTAQEWASQLVPLIAGVHGSQPIFGERKAKSEPATYCVISNEKHANRCACFTEQATVIPDVLPDVCRQWARFGRYDPFRPALAKTAPSAGQRVVSEEPDPAPLFSGNAAGEPYSIGTPDMGKVQGL